jgi:hypothetical protein
MEPEKVVEITGFEPVTSSMPLKASQAQRIYRRARSQRIRERLGSRGDTIGDRNRGHVSRREVTLPVNVTENDSRRSSQFVKSDNRESATPASPPANSHDGSIRNCIGLAIPKEHKNGPVPRARESGRSCSQAPSVLYDGFARKEAQMDLQTRCTEYLANRRATYEERKRRFRDVAQVLVREIGLASGDTLVDLGAGHCQFDFFLRAEIGWMGRYVPIDGSFDGTDLETWEPKGQADVYVLMETVEHLDDPLRLLRILNPRRGIVLTTPNPATVDVLKCDPDHRSQVSAQELREMGYSVREVTYFGVQRDTLLAWRT